MVGEGSGLDAGRTGLDSPGREEGRVSGVEGDKRVRVGVGVRVGGGVGFPGVFYPSGRQRCGFAGTYKSSTRQVSRQEASGSRQERAQKSKV